MDERVAKLIEGYQQEMTDMNITLAADDYLAKPFNIQEAVMRFNKLMGLGPIEMDQYVIEGRETRMIEGRNASMTTATMVYEDLDELKAAYETWHAMGGDMILADYQAIYDAENK